ncbi:hypothetical protein DFH08DRAFT_823668 [Mycena albidolilacea]|uniref:Uncharacterized protein n=1 Tax=Mycena albidolilacea TaxID=1033008 RepID=A0AAD6Z5W5_9AGAR|nr:hypothetical protein DFH08DRAFT_823668 [Mycena albidolilacea]
MYTAKDRVTVVAVWKAPLNVSKETLEAEIIDSVIVLPVAQKNSRLCAKLLFDCDRKFTGTEQITQRELAHQHVQALGLPEAPPSVWMMAECAACRPCNFLDEATNKSCPAPRRTSTRLTD